MSPRPKEYPFEIRALFETDGERRRFVRFGLERVGGQIVGAMVQYEVEVGDVTHVIVRFDNADGQFHRHLPGSPQPAQDREWLPGIPPNNWIAHGISEIKARYREWEQSVLPMSS